MKRIVFLVLFMVFCIGFFGVSNNQLNLFLEKVVVVGDVEPILNRIRNIAEDSQGNFYILEGRTYKAYKYSPEGKFLKKYNVGELGSLLTFFHAGDKNFFTKKYDGETPLLLMINLKPSIVNSEICKSFKSKTFRGKGVLISFNDKEFTPQLYTAYFDQYSVAASGDEYKIYILNSAGKILNIISRDLKRSRMTTKERQRFIDEVNGYKRYSDGVKKGLIGIINETFSPADY